MQQDTDTRAITNYLKGLAILGVFVNHFVNGYITREFTGYAGGLIALFFILSGYGIFHSLSRLSKVENGDFLWAFFKKRLIRIYPLFWIWCILHNFSNGLLGFFALDFIHPESPWFVPSILQCYLAAPLLFRVFRNQGTTRCLILLTALFIILNILLFSFVGRPIRTIGYQGLFFQHIFIFSLGFVLAKIKIEKEISPIIFILCGGLYLYLIQETSPQAFLEFKYQQYLMPLLFPFSVLLFCYSAYSYKGYLPAKSALQSIGKYTYSIYLFHGLGFWILVKAGILERMNPSLFSLASVIITFPLFICSYAVLDMVVTEFLFGTRKVQVVISSAKQLVHSFFPI